MPRHIFTEEELARGRSAGGKARSQMPDFPDMCRKGFWATMEKHPYFVRKHLKAKIKAKYPNGRVYVQDCG